MTPHSRARPTSTPASYAHEVQAPGHPPRIRRPGKPLTSSRHARSYGARMHTGDHREEQTMQTLTATGSWPAFTIPVDRQGTRRTKIVCTLGPATSDPAEVLAPRGRGHGLREAELLARTRTRSTPPGSPRPYRRGRTRRARSRCSPTSAVRRSGSLANAPPRDSRGRRSARAPGNEQALADVRRHPPVARRDRAARPAVLIEDGRIRSRGRSTVTAIASGAWSRSAARSKRARASTCPDCVVPDPRADREGPARPRVRARAGRRPRRPLVRAAPGRRARAPSPDRGRRLGRPDRLEDREGRGGRETRRDQSRRPTP